MTTRRPHCAAAGVDVLGLTGVGIMLLSGTRLDCVAASDAVTGDIEALELMTGQGPCLDAFRTRTECFDARPGRRPQVTWDGVSRRSAGGRRTAAFGFPVVVADDCIGVLNCYRDRAGSLSAGQVADAHLVANMSGRTMLRGRPRRRPARSRGSWNGLDGHHVVVHQAVGRVSVQAQIVRSTTRWRYCARTPSRTTALSATSLPRCWRASCASMRNRRWWPTLLEPPAGECANGK